MISAMLTALAWVATCTEHIGDWWYRASEWATDLWWTLYDKWRHE